MAPKYSVDWFSNNIPLWDDVFTKLNMKGSDNLRFLEIGSFEGRSTNYLLDNVLTGNNCTIDVVDTFGGSINEAGMNFDSSFNFSGLYDTFVKNTEPHKEKINIHVGYSGDILRRCFSKNYFDFIYIDGSHTAPDVLQDAILSHDLLKPKGILIFDDFGWSDPNNPDPTNSPGLAITCFFNCYANQYIVVAQGYQIVAIKK